MTDYRLPITWTTAVGTKTSLGVHIFADAEMQFDLSVKGRNSKRTERVYTNITLEAAVELRDRLTEFIEAQQTLKFGGYTLHRDPGGVDIKTAGGDVARLQAADLPEVIDWLTRTQP